jgi:hypothetical protein
LFSIRKCDRSVKCDKLLLRFALSFKLRPCCKEKERELDAAAFLLANPKKEVEKVGWCKFEPV